MPLIVIEEGNVFKFYKNSKQVTTIAHGCNMQGMMGAGIAKQIKDDFYTSYLHYKKICETLSIDELVRLNILMT